MKAHDLMKMQTVLLILILILTACEPEPKERAKISMPQVGESRTGASSTASSKFEAPLPSASTAEKAAENAPGT